VRNALVVAMETPIDIKTLRSRLGWTQGQLADFLGLDRSAISRMESGQAPKGPTRKLLIQLDVNSASDFLAAS